ncbi:RnfH family protein [Legionella dresdenensis]|uniref:UPF0125 protein ACFORL_06080 n=1 Tax=Legionella dresdenensis TaxID=450200 RepID=A0ABV8CEG7_9GAMM
MVKVEVIYITAGQAVIQRYCQLPTGATVADAIADTRIVLEYPELEVMAVGIFSKLVTRETVLKNGDRIEFYRPLSLDPKEKRRIRAKVKK